MFFIPPQTPQTDFHEMRYLTVKRKIILVSLFVVMVFVFCTAAAVNPQRNLSGISQLCRTAPASEIRNALKSGAKLTNEAWFEAAAHNTDTQVLKIFLDEAKRLNVNIINIKNRYGWTALMLAAKSNRNPEVVKFLIDSGADVNARDKMISVLAIARAAKQWNASAHSEIIGILFKSGARY